MKFDLATNATVPLVVPLFICTVPVEEPYIGARHAGRQKVRKMERQLEAERQRTHSARANLESTLRWRPIDDRAYHDPAGAPFRRPT